MTEGADDISVLDHVIIGDGKYVSFKEKGIIVTESADKFGVVAYNRDACLKKGVMFLCLIFLVLFRGIWVSI